ncbi:MAG: hypothetical protein ACKVP2_00315, partial [Burkholderiales bacterium]
LARALGRTLRLPAVADLTGLGICRLALMGAGICNAQTLPPLPAPAHTISPVHALSKELHQRFANAVERARGWRS